MLALIHTFNSLGKDYVFDANANSVLMLEEHQVSLVKEIEQEKPSDEAFQLLEEFRLQGYFNPPEIKEIKHPQTDAMEYHLTRNIQKLTLQVTQGCNLRCSYCAYSGDYNTRGHASKRMSFETAKKAIDYVMEHSIDAKMVSFGFYGGEPLLELELIYKCIDYINELKGEKDITFTLTTNGTLLTCEVYEGLIAKGVSILISLDGPKQLHDSYRVYPDGRGSFDDIVANINKIREKYVDANEKLRFITVVNPEMDDSCVEKLYTMDEVFPQYSSSMSFVSENYTDKKVAYSQELWSTHKFEQTKLFLYMLGKLDISKVSRLIIGSTGEFIEKYKYLRRIERLPAKCHPGGPCLAGVHRLFVSADGVFYPCERVSETSEMMKIGNIYDGIDVDKANAINNIGKTTADACKKCWAISHCTMCAANSDTLKEFSKEKRLKSCAGSKFTVVELIKDICFLKDYGYDFESNI